VDSLEAAARLEVRKLENADFDQEILTARPERIGATETAAERRKQRAD
jgi:hypothetical protein